ncbi:hypothetical protein JCM4914_01680 [Streptomyces platensis subsp. malvinus]
MRSDGSAQYPEQRRGAMAGEEEPTTMRTSDCTGPAALDPGDATERYMSRPDELVVDTPPAGRPNERAGGAEAVRGA